MKILYASDTHVHPSHLDKLLKAAEKQSPEAVIIGGDLIPSWRQSIAASIEPHRAWVRDRLIPKVREFRDRSPEIDVLLDLGNDDIMAARALMEERDGLDFHLLHQRIVKLSGNLAVAGYMKVNPTPFLIKDGEKPDCRDMDGLSEPGVLREGLATISGAEMRVCLDPATGTIEDDLKDLSNALESDAWRKYSFLFISHAPPKNSALDVTETGLHVGSLAVRLFIERWSSTGRLIATFHGHIHESPWQSGRAWQLIGSVPCFNVGQRRNPFRALTVNTQDPAQSARLVTVDQSGEIRVWEKDEWT